MDMLRRRLMLGFVLLITLGLSPYWAISEQPQAGQRGTRVPAFHVRAPAKGTSLPPILARDKLWGENDLSPFQSHAYELAAKVAGVIYQQPCYCYCDRMGHKSLHSCFEDTHGAQCSTCLKELYYCYQMTKQRKTASQIRQAIIAGEWKQVDLASAAAIQ
jgi:hypothetical protein